MNARRLTTPLIALTTIALLTVGVYGAGSASAASPSAKRLACTVTGTPKADVLIGTRGDDVICGRGGDDVIYGFDGDDVMYGGRGKDSLDGGKGEDAPHGGPGADGVVRDEDDAALDDGDTTLASTATWPSKLLMTFTGLAGAKVVLERDEEFAADNPCSSSPNKRIAFEVSTGGTSQYQVGNFVALEVGGCWMANKFKGGNSRWSVRITTADGKVGTGRLNLRAGIHTTEPKVGPSYVSSLENFGPEFSVGGGLSSLSDPIQATFRH